MKLFIYYWARDRKPCWWRVCDDESSTLLLWLSSNSEDNRQVIANQQEHRRNEGKWAPWLRTRPIREESLVPNLLFNVQFLCHLSGGAKGTVLSSRGEPLWGANPVSSSCTSESKDDSSRWHLLAWLLSSLSSNVRFSPEPMGERYPSFEYRPLGQFAVWGGN